MRQPWTTGQDDLLRKYANLGSKRCTEIIAEEYGIVRSVSATQRHAARIEVSLIEFTACPWCGRKVKKTNRLSGLCEVCHVKALAERQEGRIRDLRRELEREPVDEELKSTRLRYRAKLRTAERLQGKARMRKARR